MSTLWRSVYIVRVWLEAGEGVGAWRACALDPNTQDKHYFARPEDLGRFLGGRQSGQGEGSSDGGLKDGVSSDEPDTVPRPAASPGPQP